MQRVENMAEVNKFVTVMIIFISLFSFAMTVDGNQFLSFSNFSSYLLRFISSHSSKIFYSLFSFQRSWLTVIKILIVKQIYAHFILNRSVLCWKFCHIHHPVVYVGVI